MSAIGPLSRHPGFLSFKTRRPVHYPKRWMRIALILATIDEGVSQIIPCPTLPVERPEVYFQFWIRRSRRYTLVLLTDFTPRQLQLQAYGDRIACIPRSEVRNHPAELIARQVWRHSRTNIDPSVQIAVLERIGLSPQGEVALMDLLMLGFPVEEMTRQLMAMVASGLLSIDTSRSLGLKTVFRLSRWHEPAKNLARNSNRFGPFLRLLPPDRDAHEEDLYEKVVQP